MRSISVSGKQETDKASVPISFGKSQLVLFQSRKKFAFLYCLATVTGLFCVPGVINTLSLPSPDFVIILLMILPLPISSLLVTVGTYILNDLIDADLDKANGKKRPIPSGLVSKKQAWTFVAWTFAVAIVLPVITSSPISVLIVTMMLSIGIMYSAPKIALMKRFVIKTGSIALFYVLCALAGITSSYNLELAMDNPMLVAGLLMTLALMIFISSTLNDMGDIDGDRAAGRRTIPIVMGKENTIKLAIVLAASVLAITWAFNGAGLVMGKGSLVSAITTTLIVLIVMITLVKIKNRFHNEEFMRKQHKKLFPLQMGLHPSLIAGVMMF